MNKLKRGFVNLGLIAGLSLLCSCATPNPFTLFETNYSRKELVDTPKQVFENAKKYSLPVYTVKRNGQPMGYYAEGVITEERDKIGKVALGYECSDCFTLFDDDIYNGPRLFNYEYTATKN